MSEKKKKVFELSTERERPEFVIDGETYHFRVREDMSLKETAYLAYAGKQVEKLAGGITNPDTFDEDDAEKLETMLDRAAGICTFDLPNKIREKLTDGQKMALIGAFSDAVGLSETDSRREESTGQ